MIIVETYALNPSHRDLNNNLVTFINANLDVIPTAIENKLNRHVKFSDAQLTKFKQFLLDARIYKDGERINPFTVSAILKGAEGIITRGLRGVNSSRDWMDQSVLFVIVNLQIGIRESSQGSEVYSIRHKLPSFNPPKCEHTGFLYNNQVHFEYAFPNEMYLETILESLLRSQ